MFEKVTSQEEQTIDQTTDQTNSTTPSLEKITASPSENTGDALYDNRESSGV